MSIFTFDSVGAMMSAEEAKKAVGKQLKNEFSQLIIPSELSKKVSTKMSIEAKLKDGWTAHIACVSVKGSRGKDSFGLYWMLSLQDGPVLKVMTELGLEKHQGFFGPVFFAGTSHNLQPSNSHYEFEPTTDIQAVASVIRHDIETNCIPIVGMFCNEPRNAVDFLVNGGTGYVRNPFTSAVILLGLAGDLTSLDKVIAAAKAGGGFYDYHSCKDVNKEIIEPILNFFQAKRRG